MAATTALNNTTQLQARVEATPWTRTFTTKKTIVRTEQISPMGILFLVSLFVGSLLIYFHSVLIENQANQKQQQIIHTKEENDVLQAVLAEKKSLATVEQKAMGMGMQQVENYHYITLESSVYHQAESGSSIAIQSKSKEIRTPVGF
ncbi:hypothetical protein COW36_09635 [bacterium (Candidatus Blackallbacteria) CG17_big_fil_post_rev_8_21_14_2_50_48_46]|uniref:Uncharacterized protein n=1 Tax=bacterium (Candidatus Blackallbacteria) CG17_big_fil_post_rev_8_21_14_2_50_48_46 TaxID=2014261 RepID=A0A2M7G5P0_9BACT|nr:MAG: hypothetical protein COW64_01775 [bacterium (Candidatus Blackallbacteria) CG18_big_fil_WC_8_21_14_2_50_49_26]PIW17223.1 MAG: hypothetical protein COW36_09635 [bacterium (Candidatus Blackallbacteria) CG17_big_fil_post_rev_8_21_14_2_50_48_46]PIW51014.1 MAG: hypothetical protein COW20_00645 [bacterium (Candidatus Blackallbacteria) CG13_big_fil_rev_8_21_14_2_50_49_14]